MIGSSRNPRMGCYDKGRMNNYASGDLKCERGADGVQPSYPPSKQF